MMSKLKLTTPYFNSKTSSELIKDSINIIGFGFDGTACYRKGAKHGPVAIREASSSLESFSPYLQLDLEDFNNIYDLGNLPVLGDDPEKAWESANLVFYNLLNGKNLKEDNIKIITLGGEHSISFAPIISYMKKFNDVIIVHLDAHADLRDGYQGFYYSHASIIKRVIDKFSDKHKLIQYGIRSGEKNEFKWMSKNNTLIYDLDSLCNLLNEINNNRPIYLTLDLDFFDPAFMPGTGTPEPGGETFNNFIKIINILKNKNFVGADIVELAPNIDSTGNSSVFAAKITREIILSMENNNQ